MKFENYHTDISRVTTSIHNRLNGRFIENGYQLNVSTYIIAQTKYKFRNPIHVRSVLIKYDRKPGQIPSCVNFNTEILLQHLSLLLEQLCVHLYKDQKRHKSLRLFGKNYIFESSSVTTSSYHVNNINQGYNK